MAIIKGMAQYQPPLQLCSTLSFVIEFPTLRSALELVDMGVSKEQALENRKAIIAASERLFRERGIDSVGLNELMKAAGFTQGGFYNHFSSKDALATEVVTTAVARSKQKFQAAIAATPDEPGERLRRRVKHYLSESHCRDIADGCAIAGLAADVSRLGGKAQEHFAEKLSEMFDIMSTIVDNVDDEVEQRQRAIGIYCEMFGALVLSRAVGNAAPRLAQEILAGGRAALIGNSNRSSAREVSSRHRRSR